MPIATVGYAAQSTTGPLSPYKYQIRDLKDKDVHVRVLYCGICHTDIHQVRAEWGSDAIYPMVPGHEVVGVVEGVGKSVKNFKKGDYAAIGCFVDCCHKCKQCEDNQEQLCPKAVWSYNAKGYDGQPTYGGYGKDMVCDEHFVVKVPSAFTKDELMKVAPLMCAGITVWAPMKKYGMDKPGKKIGVVGLGGLGHMAVKFGVAFGNEVTVMSRSEGKKKEAIEEFGATRFVVSKDPAQMAAVKGTLDFIIDTVAAGKPMQPYLDLLAVGGTMVCVALPPAGNMIEVAPIPFIMEQKQIVGSLVGGMKDTQEMMDFCAAKHVVPMCEMITGDKINEAYERTLKSDVRYRFVIDQEATKY